MRLILIITLFLSVFQNKGAFAADLINIRTGNNDLYTRIVFVFKDHVVFENPEFQVEGLFSIVFFNINPPLPHEKPFEEQSNGVVRSIEFVQRKSNLEASIRLSFPFFSLKSFSLSNPYRVVIDVFQTIEKPRRPMQEDYIVTTTTGDKRSDLSETTLSDLLKNHEPDTNPEFLSPFSENSAKKLYLPIVLYVLTSAVVFLIVFLLIQKRQRPKRHRLFKIIEFIDKSDIRIRKIDHQLKGEFEKFKE